MDKMIYCVTHSGSQCQKDGWRGIGEVGKMEKQRELFGFYLLCLPACFGLMFSNFLLHSTAGVRGGYGGKKVSRVGVHNVKLPKYQ